MKVLFFDITMNMTTKEKVLKILAEAKGQSVSGETLAAECGVSRAAVWKAVTALREAGNSIEGTTNGGYVLADDDIFSHEIFSETFSARWPDFSDCHIECFNEIDSTNTHAKRLLAETGNPRQYHKAILIAEKQTAGRGRIGRTFVSPEKSGIYFSIIYAPEGGITDPARLTASSAVAQIQIFSLKSNGLMISSLVEKRSVVSGPKESPILRAALLKLPSLALV